MKNFFRIIGVCALFFFGFFCTDKTAMVMENADEVMVNLKEVSGHYTVDPVEAVIMKDTMIPGLGGQTVDLHKSYKNMKRVGTFNEEFLEYSNVLPKQSLKKNFNYYIISGNPKKNMVSLLFHIDKNTDNMKLEKILDILKVKGVPATFFIDGYWFEENNDFVNHLVYLGHDLGNASYSLDYTDSSFIWMDTVMKRVLKRKTGFCYNERDNQMALDTCKMYKNYTIRPSIVVTEGPLTQIKKEVTAGSLISFEITDATVNELPSIITYITSKGYKIDTLTKHLEEFLYK